LFIYLLKMNLFVLFSLIKNHKNKSSYYISLTIIIIIIIIKVGILELLDFEVREQWGGTSMRWELGNVAKSHGDGPTWELWVSALLSWFQCYPFLFFFLCFLLFLFYFPKTKKRERNKKKKSQKYSTSTPLQKHHLPTNKRPSKNRRFQIFEQLP